MKDKGQGLFAQDGRPGGQTEKRKKAGDAEQPGAGVEFAESCKAIASWARCALTSRRSPGTAIRESDIQSKAKD